METLLAVLHVVSAVFIVGPMAILPMTAMRAVRAGNAGQVRTLATSTNLLSLLSLLVAVFGFGTLGLADKKHEWSITTPWILWSIIAYVIALGLTLFVVVPAMRNAAEALDARAAAGAPAAAPEGATPAAEAADLSSRGYPAIAAASGVASLLLVVVVVLMVWKP